MYSIYHDLTLSLLSVDPLFLADIYHIEFQVFCGSALVGLVHSCVLREHLVIDDTCTKWLICCPGIPSPDLSACVEKLLGKGAWRILASPLTGPWDWPASSIRTGDFHWLLLPMGFFFFFSPTQVWLQPNSLFYHQQLEGSWGVNYLRRSDPDPGPGIKEVPTHSS